MKAADRIVKKLNDECAKACDHAFENEFSFPIETSFSIIEMRMVSTPMEPKTKFSREQRSWLAGFSEGYAAAMNRVR